MKQAIKITPGQSDELCKEWCYYLGNVEECCGNCDICEGNGKWKQYRLPVKRLIEKWEKIKYASKN